MRVQLYEIVFKNAAFDLSGEIIMSNLLITNAKIYSETGVFEGWLQCDNGKIVAMGQGSPTSNNMLDAGGRYLLPGFIDVHVHGAVGVDTMDANVDGLLKMADFFASRGVTSFLPTTVTSSHEVTLAALEAIKIAMTKQSKGAQIIGSHLEGPYLNVEKCGAQNPEYVRPCDPDEARLYLDSDILRLVSIAPEIEANQWLVEECVRRHIQASIAHTTANYQQTKAAIDLGIRHATHTYNAMVGLHHREPGTLGAVMTDERVMCELIADTVHVHPVAMNILWQVKGRDGIVLITDAMRAAGQSEGDYELGTLAVTVKDGRATLADGTLAGSVLTMDAAIRNFIAATGETLENIWQVFSLNAAKTIGISEQKGSIAIGKDADFALVDADIHVMKTIIAGEIVYSD